MTQQDNGYTGIFPEETDLGTIVIEGGTIISKGKHPFYGCIVEIDKIETIYLVIDEYQRTMLVLVQNVHNQLPVFFTGFQNLYHELSKRFQINHEAFFSNVLRKEPLKRELWWLKKEENFRILDGLFEDYGIGFEILSPEPEFINWDTSYEKLLVYPYFTFSQGLYDNKICTFQFPVRFGGIVLTGFNFSAPHPDYLRSDVEVFAFHAICYDETNTEISYYRLFDKLNTDLGPSRYLGGINSRNGAFLINQMLISLGYRHVNVDGVHHGLTYLNIESRREYPDLLLDPGYEAIMEVTKFITLDTNIKIDPYYKRNSRIKNRPKIPGLENILSPVMWLDTKNNKVGFADMTYSHIIDKEDIESVTIQNIQPARGEGGSELLLNLKSYRGKYRVFSGTINIFNPLHTKIPFLIGLEANFGPRMNDA